MKFLADECFDARLAQFIRQLGHDVSFQSEAFEGASDKAVLSRAAAEERILLTEDKDFGELVIRLRLPAYGVIFVRLEGLTLEHKQSRLSLLLKNGAARLPRHFTVVETKRTRFRPL